MAALRHRKSPDAPARLNAEQKQQLLAELAQGAEAHGFAGDVWTTEGVAQFILQRFGVKYHHDSIGPLFAPTGLESAAPGGLRQPARRSRHRTMGWRRTSPSCKKAVAEARTLLFVDESAFYLLPGVVSTWAPVLRCKLTATPMRSSAPLRRRANSIWRCRAKRTTAPPSSPF